MTAPPLKWGARLGQTVCVTEQLKKADLDEYGREPLGLKQTMLGIVFSCVRSRLGLMVRFSTKIHTGGSRCVDVLTGPWPFLVLS